MLPARAWCSSEPPMVSSSQVPPRHQYMGLAWAQAAFLTLYGLVFTAVGLLVQSGVLHASADADRYAMAWHTYLWDPWFLVWGLLVLAALRPGRHRFGAS
jgi:hypothetical protein